MANPMQTNQPYQAPQNILAAILASRKQQGGAVDPGVQMQPSQAQTAPLPMAKAPIDPMQIINGYLGVNQQPAMATNSQASQPNALASLTSQNGANSIPGAQPPTNAFAQLTGIGNPNQSNAQNIGALLAQLFGGS